MTKLFVVMSGLNSRISSFPRRIVCFAAATPGSPSTPGGSETAEELTLNNLREKIMELDGNKLNHKQASAVMFILSKGTQEDKEKTLDAVKQMLARNEDGKWLMTYLPKVQKGETKAGEENAEGTEKPESSEKNEGAEKKEGEEAKEQVEPEITEITRRINSDIAGLLGEQQKMAANLETKTGAIPENAAERMKKLGTDIEALDKLAQDNIKPLKDLLDKHIKDNKIDKKTAIKIINLQTTAKNFESRFKELTEKLGKEEKDNVLNELKQLGEREKKIHEDFTKRSGEAAEILNSMTTEMLNKIERQEAVERLEHLTGLPLKPGTKLRYRGTRMNNSGGKDQVITIAEITAVDFEDIEIKDAKGNKVKQPGTTPSVTIKWTPVDNEDLGQCTYSSLAFKRKVDSEDICPMINAITEEKLPENERGQKLSLESFLEEKIAVGDTFELREQTLNPDNKPVGINKKVKVLAIDENAKTVTLDQEVLTADLPNPKREKVLSFDAFAKWFRKSEVVREITSLGDLRKMLGDLQERRNKSYADSESGAPRPGSAFPPIEVIKGEKLKYDTPDNPSFFEIKDANDKEITLTDGTKFTPGTFYNWVKNHEVEKVTPENTTKKEEAEAQLPSGDDDEEPEQFSVNPEEIKKLTPDQKPKKSKSWIGKVWADTRFLSFFDMKFLWERYTKFFIGKKVRKIKTHQLETARMLGHASDFMFRAVGHKPSAAREWEADAQSDLQKLEMEKVSKLKETMKEYGVFQLRSTLYQKISQDYCRACLEILADKGEIRWDDKYMWEAVTKAGEKNVGLQVTDQESLIYVMDKLWGEGMYHGLRNKNDSTYNSHRSTFNDMAERIGSDPNNNGGLEGALRILLYKHLQGDYVNPAEYEAYLTYAMEAGKLTFDQKLYFLIMGLGARGKKPNVEGWKGDKGMTLLSIDRYSKIESGYLNKFPIVQYFLTPVPRLDENDEPIYEVFKDKNGKIFKKHSKGAYSVGNYSKLIRERIVEDLSKITSPDDCKPTDTFKEFIKKDMVWDPSFKVRVAEKASKNVSNWDHDDMDMFGPMMSEANVNLIAAIQGSGEQKASIAAQKNAYVGFNDYTHTTLDLMKESLDKNDQESTQLNIKRMVHFLRSFVRYDGIMTQRYKPDGSLSRLSNQDLNEKAGVDGSRQIIEHIKEMRHLIGGIAENVGIGSNWQKVLEKVDINDKQARDRQSNQVEEFGAILESAIGEYIKANGPLAFAKLVQDIESKAGDLRVKGNLGRPENKVKAKEVADKGVSLEIMDNESLRSKVATLRELRAGKYVTKAELAKRDQARLEEVISNVESGHFSKVTREDAELIDSAIASMKQQLEGESSQSAPESKPKKGKKN